MRFLANQPKSFYLIFFIEFWERFGYYGLTALMVLYMTQRLGYTDTHADMLFASFSALVYLLVGLGGMVGDRVLGTKRTIVLGAVILALGYLALSIPFFTSHFLELPLAIIAVGNGLFKANPSSLLSKVYEGTDYNRDSGFTLYYMAINMGSFIAIILTPILSQHFGWHVAFFASFLGLLLALISYAVLRGSVSHVGSVPDMRPLRKDHLSMVLLAAGVMVVLCWWMLNHYQVTSWLLIIATVLFFAFYIFEMRKSTAQERKGMILFLALFVQGIVFFVLYFQMQTSLTLFAQRNISHSIWGIPVLPAQFQSLNPLWILVMSPVLAALYQKLSKKNRDLSLPAKFALGTMLAGLSFVIFPIAAMFFAHDGVLSSGWMVASYWLQSTGELLVSALGLSLVARYIPQRMMGYTMGLWFLCTSIASVIAGKVASLASIPKHLSSNPLASLPVYNHLFWQIGIVTIVFSLVFALFIPKLNRMTAASSD